MWSKILGDKAALPMSWWYHKLMAEFWYHYKRNDLYYRHFNACCNTGYDLYGRKTDTRFKT